jgi:hypothetical protein
VTVIISIVTVAVALVLCLLVLLIRFVLYRWRRWLAVARVARRSYLEKLPKQAAYYRGKSVCEDELEKGTGPRRFTYDELAAATNGFSSQNKLGEGGFGSVYRNLATGMDSGVLFPT